MLSFLKLCSESLRSKLSHQQGGYKKESGRELLDSFFWSASKLQKERCAQQGVDHGHNFKYKSIEVS
jgi:hypothetical protein